MGEGRVETPQPRQGRGEHAGAGAGVQVRLVVDMEPLRPVCAGHIRRRAYQPGAEAAPLPVRVHRRIEQNGVGPTIPGQVDDAEPKPNTMQRRSSVSRARVS